MRILLVEDDTEAAAYLVKGLTESGHAVEHVAFLRLLLRVPSHDVATRVL